MKSHDADTYIEAKKTTLSLKKIEGRKLLKEE